MTPRIAVVAAHDPHGGATLGTALPAVATRRLQAPAVLGLPERRGPAPQVQRPSADRPRPHAQRSQQAPVALQERLLQRAAGLSGVVVGRSLVSLPQARALLLDGDHARGPRAAFQRGTEFAHLHGAEDGSLHLTLPPDVAEEVLATGWGEPHPLSGTTMLYGPRDDLELEVAWLVLRASYAFATGSDATGTDGGAPATADVAAQVAP